MPEIPIYTFWPDALSARAHDFRYHLEFPHVRRRFHEGRAPLAPICGYRSQLNNFDSWINLQENSDFEIYVCCPREMLCH